jgi:hypothetical protein
MQPYHPNTIVFMFPKAKAHVGCPTKSFLPSSAGADRQTYGKPRRPTDKSAYLTDRFAGVYQFYHHQQM